MGSTKTENESNTLRGSVINSAQSSGKENNWKCDSQELFERKLSCILCFINQEKGSSWKRFDPEI